MRGVHAVGYAVPVSIHASVKDATSVVGGSDEDIAVSIHASVKDATLYLLRILVSAHVSIHASVKDATGAQADC